MANKLTNFVAAQVKVADTREETLMGRDHLVVPVVALTEMVLQGVDSDGPELALAEEFGSNVLAWNGRPVVVNHPEIDGNKVSASLPEVVDAEKIGEIYNTTLDDKKLKLEAWIDLGRVKTLGGDIAETVDKLRSGEEIIEVSTGLFANIEDKSGTFEGEDYQGVWRNVVPDHLAILSEGPGACSVEDGCGAPRANSKQRCNDPNCVNCNGKRKSIFSSIRSSLLKIAGAGMSHETKRRMLSTAIREKMNSNWVWLEAVYEDTVVFQTDDGGLFELGYTMTEEEVTFDEEAMPVVAQVEFVPPLKVNKDGTFEMDKEKFIDKLVANKGNKFVEDDKKWLNTMSEEQLLKLEPEEIEKVDDKDDKDGIDAGAAGDVKVVDPEADVAPISLESYIKAAPKEIGSVLSEGIRLQAEKRINLVGGIVANERNSFSKESLEAMDTPTLENLAKLAEVDDYSGRGAPRVVVDNENSPPKMPLVFPAQAAS